jgi:hypothetical protein
VCFKWVDVVKLIVEGISHEGRYVGFMVSLRGMRQQGGSSAFMMGYMWCICVAAS